MKYKLFLLFALSGICSNVYAQFSIGSVQYSILDSTAFYKLNPGWVLMDGRSIKGTRLAAQLGADYKLPDARGMFIRGMNEKHSILTGDSEGDRKVGGAQKDTVKSHNHQLKSYTISNYNYGQNGIDNRDDGGAQHATTTTDSYGGSETRPRNIALYVYIKVD